MPRGIASALREWAARSRGHVSCTSLLYFHTCSVGPHKLKIKLSRISSQPQLRVNQTWGSSEHAALCDCTCHMLTMLTDSSDAIMRRMEACPGQWTCSWVWLCATLSQTWDVQVQSQIYEAKQGLGYCQQMITLQVVLNREVFELLRLIGRVLKCQCWHFLSRFPEPEWKLTLNL